MTILKTLKIDYFLIYQAVVSFEGWNIRFKPKSVSIVGNITLPGLQASGSAYTWQSFGPEAPIEKRLEAVEAIRCGSED
jgi:hypothetical protein